MSSTTCITCGAIIPVGIGGRCWRHRPPARRIRSSAAWIALSRAIRAPGFCSMCGRFVGAANLQADHIARASDHPELALQPGNVRALCVPCHRKVSSSTA